MPHKHHDKWSHKNTEFIEFYSWMIGFIKGVGIGATYEFFHNNNAAIDLEKVEEGFSYGYKESIWCCDLI